MQKMILIYLNAGIEKRDESLTYLIIGPESDHWLCLSLTNWLTNWLTHSCLVNLIDVSLACEDGNSKLVEVVTVVNIDDEKRFDDSCMQIWKLKFGLKAKFCSDF